MRSTCPTSWRAKEVREVQREKMGTSVLHILKRPIQIVFHDYNYPTMSHYTSWCSMIIFESYIVLIYEYQNKKSMNHIFLVGGWATPLKNMSSINWDD